MPYTKVIYMQGWITLHRQIVDNPMWLSETFTRSQAWIDLLVLANHKESSFYVRDNQITVKRGQIGRSEEYFSSRWKWSRTKVRNFLKKLETEQQIARSKSHVLQIITIINYDKYQEKEQQENNKKTTRKQQENIYNNVNNVKQDNKILQKHESFAEKFYKALERNEKVIKSINYKSQSWVKPIQLLETQDKIEWETIKLAAGYYFENIDSLYMPEIRSTSAFRKKFDKLVSHYERARNAEK